MPAAAKPKRPFIAIGAVLLAVIAAISASAYWLVTKDRVYTDAAQVYAPQIALAPKAPGTLEQVFVQDGDTVGPDTVVARVGNELIKTKTSGLVVATVQDGGKLVNAGESVVTIIDPDELRVVAKIDENKGLNNILVGQPVVFTVDAFGSKKFNGVVDEVSSTSHAGDVVFSISDQRPVAQFDVKIRFNPQLYPELKNGMSAKVWIYKN